MTFKTPYKIAKLRNLNSWVLFLPQKCRHFCFVTTINGVFCLVNSPTEKFEKLIVVIDTKS